MKRLLCALTLGVTLLCLAQSPASRPDVYLITIDTLRADHVHSWGYQRIQTPALDGLAQDGIRFSQAFTASPVTNSSHASILTGLLPHTHGVTDFGVPLAPGHQTLADLLSKDGYNTSAFIGAVILDSRTLAPGFDRGFGYYDNFPANAGDKSRWGRLERRGMDVAARAEAWLRAHPRGPHFMWLHFYDPHDPYEPPPPYPRTYDGEVAYADAALGHFLAFLKSQGDYRDSLIIVVGDHGEGLGEHREETHGIFLYDSTMHVPLVLKLPQEREQGRVVDAEVRTVDILPTILQFVRPEEATPGLDGQGLQPYFDAIGPDRDAFGETDYPMRFGWAPLRSLRTKESLLVEAPRPEFYDLRSDFAEVTNRYEPWNEEVKKLREKMATQRSPSAARGSAAVGRQTIAELRALGYLGRADMGSSTNVIEPSLLPDPKDKIEEQNLLHRAMMATEEGLSAPAREALAQLLRLNPESVPALRQWSELELQAGEFSRAAGHLRSAFALEPGDAAVALLLGRALEKLHDLPGARKALEASVNLSAGQFEARMLLGQVCFSLGDAIAAEDQFAAALLIRPGDREALLWNTRAKVAVLGAPRRR
jgi:arylsulfatase A-like enzyme